MKRVRLIAELFEKIDHSGSTTRTRKVVATGRRSRPETVFFSVEGAARVRRQRLADVDRGLPVSSKANTVKFEDWPPTSLIDDVECRYRLHLLPALGNRKASQIT